MIWSPSQHIYDVVKISLFAKQITVVRYSGGRGVTNHQWFEYFDLQILDLWIDLLVFWETGFDLSIWFALRSDLNWFELKFRMNWFEIQIKCKSLALPNLINSTYQLPTIIMIFPISMGLPMSKRVHGTASDMEKHLPWFAGRIRPVLLMNLVLLVARIY